MMKKVAVLVEQQFHDTELWVPYYRMLEAGFQVSLVGPEAHKEYLSKHGDPVKTDMSSAEAKEKEWDAVIVPGGWAPDFLRRDRDLLEMIRKTRESGGIVAGICHAQSVFISADILRGVEATSYFSIKDDVINAGVKWVDREVAIDGNIITSRSPKDLPAYCKAIVAALQER